MSEDIPGKVTEEAANLDTNEADELTPLEVDSEDSDEESFMKALSPAEEREMAESLVASEDSESILPEASDEELDQAEEKAVSEEEFTGTELEAYEGAEIEDVEFIETERLESIIESILFASDRPVSLASIRQVFKGTSVKKKQITDAIDNLSVRFADPARGVSLEEVTSGYQLRTKIDNMEFLQKTMKGRPFRLSGPALEVLSIAAYKQPLVKIEIDEIRGVESGHLLRALMEKGLVSFAGKSELPGKPMLYQTTKKFLEIFGLRNIKELPSLSDIDNLLPEGIGDDEEKESLSDLTDGLSENAVQSYSTGEEELGKISDQLSAIETSTDFFEDEKKRQKEKREKERAQDIRDAMEMGEEVLDKDQKWLERYDRAIEEARIAAEAELAPAESVEEVAEETAALNQESAHVEAEELVAAEAQIIASAEALDEATEESAAEEIQAETEEPVVETKKTETSAKAGHDHSGVVNEKLARALAAFREGFSEKDPTADPEATEKKPPETEV